MEKEMGKYKNKCFQSGAFVKNVSPQAIVPCHIDGSVYAVPITYICLFYRNIEAFDGFDFTVIVAHSNQQRVKCELCMFAQSSKPFYFLLSILSPKREKMRKKMYGWTNLLDIFAIWNVLSEIK